VDTTFAVLADHGKAPPNMGCFTLGEAREIQSRGGGGCRTSTGSRAGQLRRMPDPRCRDATTFDMDEYVAAALRSGASGFC